MQNIPAVKPDKLKSDKLDFQLSDFNFHIVKMEVFHTNSNIKQSELTYFLLVDDDNLIHDYKFAFKLLNISKHTTLSHQKVSPMEPRLERRIDMLKVLNIEHGFISGAHKYIEIDKPDVLEKLNYWIKQKSWKEITFQNIEYIITGSNPSGQGISRGYLRTNFEEFDCGFGFFLRALNIATEIKNNYDNVDYQTVWDSYFDVHKIEEIDFNTWITDASLYRFFKDYVNNRKNWKIIDAKIKHQLNERKKKFLSTENEVRNLRVEYVKAIKRKFGTQKQSIIQTYFKQAITTEYDHAHIKPVYQIKKEYKIDGDKNILDQIADPNNFLPLSPNVHNLYDKQYFYWKLDGNLECIKSDKNFKFINNDIKGFEKIDNAQLEHIKKYLKDYNKLINKNLHN